VEIISDLPFYVYQDKGRDCLSKHQLDDINLAIEKWEYSNEHKHDTGTLGFGRCFHDFVLLNSVFSGSWAIQDKADGRTREGKEYKTQFALKNLGKQIIERDQFDRIQAMHNKVTPYLESLGPYETEVSAFADIPSPEGSQVKFRGRADILTADKVIDLKTISDIRNFRNDIYRYRYHVQMAIYQDLFGKSGNMLIFVQSEAPHLIALVEIHQDEIDKASDTYKRDIAKFMNWRMGINKFSGFAENLIVVGENKKIVEY
jgi:hypothetical protein